MTQRERQIYRIDRSEVRRKTAAWILLVLFMVNTVPVQAQDVPESTQLPILLKLLTYDRTLWENPDPHLRIGILVHSGNEESEANHGAMVAAMEAAADITVNQVSYEYSTLTWKTRAELQSVIEGAQIDILYITMGHEAQIEKIFDTTRERDILTLTGSPGFVKVGLSVGIELQEGRPRLLVNLKALSEEGHQLDSRVLRLCTVVDP